MVGVIAATNLSKGIIALLLLPITSPTVGPLRGGDGVELAHAGDEAHVRLHAVEGVVPGRAGHEVGRGGGEAELVEVPRDPGGGEAAPVVVVAGEEAREHGDLRVACGMGGGQLVGWVFFNFFK